MMNSVLMFQRHYDKIREAIYMIQRGCSTKVQVNEHITVYQCKNVIRIDLKE